VRRASSCCKSFGGGEKISGVANQVGVVLGDVIGDIYRDTRRVDVKWIRWV